MTPRPFDFVAHEATDGTCYAWPWEFAYYIGSGDTQDTAVASAKAALDRELDRRESTDAQYKFKPGQWPAPLKLIHERVGRDAERRKMPPRIRSYSDWLDSNPIQLPDQCLSPNATDDDIEELLRHWGTLICDGSIDDAIALIADATSVLPMSDFPLPQTPLKAVELRSMLDSAGVQRPFARVDAAGPTVTRIESPASAIDHGQRLVCGLGKVVFVASYSIALRGTGRVLETEIHGFATDLGILPAFCRLSIGWDEGER
jgi:hypothetical protein